MSSTPSWSSFGLRIALGAALVGDIFWTQEIDLKALWKSVRSASLPLVFMSLAGFLLLMGLKCWRWKFLMERAGIPYPFPPPRPFLGQRYRRFTQAQSSRSIDQSYEI